MANDLIETLKIIEYKDVIYKIVFFCFICLI